MSCISAGHSAESLESHLRNTEKSRSLIYEYIKINSTKTSRSDNIANYITIDDGISEILENNGIGSDSISCILAGSMITSEFGLVELEHITLLCGIE